MNDIQNENTYKPYSFSVGVLKIMAILFFFGGLYGFYFYVIEPPVDANKLFEDMKISATALQQIKITNLIAGISFGLGGITLSATLSLFIGIFKKVVWDEE